VSEKRSKRPRNDAGLDVSLGFSFDLWVDPVALIACIVVDGEESRRRIETSDIGRLADLGYRLKSDDRLGCDDGRSDGDPRDADR
jgi:hypothetical protein